MSFVKEVSYVDLMLQNRTLRDIKECICLLRDEFQEHGIPIDENSSVLNRFCSKLELLLQLGLKEKSSSRRSKGDYFTFLSEGVRDNKSLNDGVRFVKLQKEYKTRVGQGRALIRYSLVHRLLADSIQHCINNDKIVAKWYIRSSSVMSNTELTSELINALYDLNDIIFDLDPTIHDLDIRWPLSSRSSKNVNSMNMWRPPTRSTSIGSLNSINPQDDSFCTSMNTSYLSSSLMSREISLEERSEETTGEVKGQGNLMSEMLPGTGAEMEQKDFVNSEVVSGDVVKYQGLLEEAEKSIEELTLQLQQQRDANCAKDDECVIASASSPSYVNKTSDTRASFEEDCTECTRVKNELKESKRSMNEMILSMNETAQRLNDFEIGQSESNFMAKAFEDLERDNENLRETLVVLERDKQQREDVLNDSLAELERKERELQEVRLQLSIRCDESEERAKKLERNYAHLVNFAQRASDLCSSLSRSRSPTKTLSKSLDMAAKTDKSSLDEILVRLDESIKCSSWSGDSSFINRRHQILRVSKSRDLDAELNGAKREVDDLRAQLLGKENEIVELKDQMERQNEVNATLVRVKDSVVQRLNAEVEKGKEMEKELKRDMEEMMSSFKRREILMEEARTGFERSRLLEYDQWTVEVESLKQIIQELESKIAKDLTLEKKREFEENITSLEDTIVSLKEELANLKQQHDEWVSNMNNRLEDFEGENVSLRNQVSQMTRYERQMREEFHQKECDWSNVEEGLRADITAFKMRVGKLVKDKEKLWQVNDRLKDREATTSSFKWIDSSTVTHCSLCNTAFSLAVRKHHCRRCGNVMCSICCSNWMDLPHSSAKVRVCNSCENFINSSKNESVDLQCNSDDEVSKKDLESAKTIGVSNVSHKVEKNGSGNNYLLSPPLLTDDNVNDGDDEATGICDTSKSDDEVFNGNGDDDDGKEGGSDDEPINSKDGDVNIIKGDDVDTIGNDKSQNCAVKKFYVGDADGGGDDDDVAEDADRNKINKMSADVSSMSEQQLSSNGWHQDNLSTPEPQSDQIKSTAAIAIHPSTFSKLTGGMRSAASWVTSAAAASLMKTTSHMSGIFGLGQSPIQGNDDNTYLYDDRYEYLSPEEIIHSKILNSSADDSIVIADVINRPGTMTNDSFELVRDLLPDKILVVPVYLGVEGGRATAMHWCFHSEPKGIKFSISYQKTAEHLPISTSPPRSADHYPMGLDTNPIDDPKKRHISNLSYLTSSMIHPFSSSSSQDLGWTTSASLPDMETILPMTKVQSDLKNVSGCLVPKSSGVYIFIFDHTRSSLLTKKIFLQLILVSQSIADAPSDEG